jgi:hypothetical protein
MLQTRHWAVPQFNGLPYLDKPVLLFWMIAAVFRVVGVGEAAARLPSALAAIATVALTFDLGRLLLGRRRALLAATVLATSPIVLVYARLVIFDMLLTALVTAALCCLVRARVGGNGRLWLPLAGMAMGFATLTKGPVGIAVPLLAWVAARGALPPSPNRSRIPVLTATIALLFVVVPWIAVVAWERPDFLHYAILDETLLRVTSPERFHRGAPFYFYGQTLAWALGVWGVALAVLVPSLVRRYRAGGHDAAVIAFAVRAAGAIVVFFTLCASKRPHYILPALIPLSLLTAVGLAAEREKVQTAVRMLARVLPIAGLAMLVAAASGYEGRGEFVVVSPRLLTTAGLFLVVWGIAATLGGGRRAVAIGCLASFAPGLVLVLLGPLTPYAEGRSARTLASHIDPTIPVFCFDTFRTSLPFYVGHPVVLVSDSGRPLTSNYVVARRTSLETNVHLVSISALPALLDASSRSLVVANRSNARRLMRMSSQQLLRLYSDRSSILFQPRG